MNKLAALPPVPVETPLPPMFMGYSHMVKTPYEKLVEESLRRLKAASGAPTAAAPAKGLAKAAPAAASWLEGLGPQFSKLFKTYPTASAIIGGALGALILRKLLD